MLNVIYKSIVVTCVVSILCVGFSNIIFAQSSDLKIGFVDLQRVVSSSEEGKRVQEDIQKRADQLSQKAEGMRKELESMKEGYETQRLALTSEARRGKLDEIGKIERELSRFVQDSQEEIRTTEQRVLKRLLLDIGKLVVEYGEQHGFTVILEAGNILYGAESIEITDGIIEAYNSRK